MARPRLHSPLVSVDDPPRAITEALHDELAHVDPERAAGINPRDPERLAEILAGLRDAAPSGYRFGVDGRYYGYWHSGSRGGKTSTVQVEQTLPTVTQAQDNRARLAETTLNGTTPADQAPIQPDEISLDGTYWVYENWRAQGHKAVIHRATCRYCNNGRGQNGGTDPSNGRWHGPFAPAALAEAKAQMSGGHTRSCRFCRPT